LKNRLILNIEDQNNIYVRRMMMMGLFFFALLLLHGAAAAKPHILLMVLDDIGRADTGIYGASNIPMTNLVSLAKNGVVLDNFYTQTVCSPTRSALLTGQYPFRYGMQHITTQLPGMVAGVPLTVPMIPALLAEKGYERHIVGKWHCGYASWGHTPMKRGFQSYTGFFQAQGDYYKHDVAIATSPLASATLDGLDFWHNERPMWEAVGNHSLDVYRSALSEVLAGYAARQDTPEKREEHPLFVYLAHQTVHVPLQPRSERNPRCSKIAHKVRNTYCSMMVELDDAIGEMVEQYKSLELWENTLVVVMTDNGGMVNFNPRKEDGYPSYPASQGSNFPLRGSKTTLLEGGTRSLAFVSGGLVPSHVRSKHFSGLAHAVDFHATILTVAGVLPLKKEELKIDGFNLLPLLFDKSDDQVPVQQRDHVPINIVDGGQRYSAVRFGKYKLIIDDFMTPSAQNWFDESGDVHELAETLKGKTVLFDLEDDPTEHKDIAALHPQLVQRGKDLIQMYVTGGRFLEPQESFTVHPKALPLLHGGVWKPFMSESDWTEQFERENSKTLLLRKQSSEATLDQITVAVM